MRATAIHGKVTKNRLAGAGSREVWLRVMGKITVHGLGLSYCVLPEGEPAFLVGHRALHNTFFRVKEIKVVIGALLPPFA